jgi:hypothetical protein
MLANVYQSETVSNVTMMACMRLVFNVSNARLSGNRALLQAILLSRTNLFSARSAVWVPSVSIGTTTLVPPNTALGATACKPNFELIILKIIVYLQFLKLKYNTLMTTQIKLAYYRPVSYI